MYNEHTVCSTETDTPVNTRPRGRPRKKPTNPQLSSFLIDKGLRGSQLKKELGLGGRVDIQHLDAALWLNPEVVLRRLTVTVGGFRIELLPGPSYDTMGSADAGQAVSFQDGLTYGGEVTLAVASDDQAVDQKPTMEDQVGAGGLEEDAALVLGPYVNPNDVQATNGSPTEPNSCSEETNQSASAKEKAPAKGNDAAKPTPNPPNNKTGSTTKDDCKDKLKLFAKALIKPKPSLPTVKDKSLVSRRPKSQIKGPNPPPTSPSKLPQREEVSPHAKSPKERTLKRPGENHGHPDHTSKVQKVQTGKPANAKPKSPGPSSAMLLRRTPSTDVRADQPDAPKHGPSHAPKPTPPPLGSPGHSSKPPEDGGPDKSKGDKKPDKLLQRQKSKPARGPSVEEPQLFVPDNAPAAAATVRKESTEEPPADETPADGAWDGTNSCSLCRKHHSNM